MILTFLLSPIGRYVALGAIAVVLCTGLYWKIRSDAVALAEARRMEIELERIKNAIIAGDAVITDPERLRDKDRFNRD